MSHSSKARIHLLVLAIFAPLALAVALFVGLSGVRAEESPHEDHGATGGHDHALRLNGDQDLASRLVGSQDGAVSTQTAPVPGNFTTGGFTSNNVEYIGFLPFEKGSGEPVPGQPQEIVSSTGANIRGNFMYLTGWKSISIYNISDPLNPKLTAYKPVGFMFENENVATNGEIMLFSESLPGNALHVYDVSDKTRIREIATVEGAGDHTTTCLLGCKWAYGSDGSITDLRDPRNPKLMKQDWHRLTGLNEDGAHDVDEYKTGFLVTSPISDDFQVLDVRNPLAPKVIGRGKHPQPDDFLFHSGTWPRAGEDRFVLMQGEKNFRTRCDRRQGPVMTYDKVEGTSRFELKDRYRVENGTYVDGAPPINGLGCSAHWFEVHPTWKNGGLMALGYYEHGTHFLRVAGDGEIRRVGYFLPHAGSTSAAYWLNRRVVYAVDYT
ncbi:MAG TPA: hypothetical protein VGP38_11330, partial [Rubrobacter sp.]|nr:hypothetical protein [Rubrobacter sp.]